MYRAFVRAREDGHAWRMYDLGPVEEKPESLKAAVDGLRIYTDLPEFTEVDAFYYQPLDDER